MIVEPEFCRSIGVIPIGEALLSFTIQIENCFVIGIRATQKDYFLVVLKEPLWNRLKISSILLVEQIPAKIK